MHIQTRNEHDVPIASLSGRFDAFEVPIFNQWLTESVTPGTRYALVDLGGVEFIDSSALAALVKGLKRCREAGGEMLLCNLQQAVLIIFELTRLDKAFKIFADADAAIRSLVPKA